MAIRRGLLLAVALTLQSVAVTAAPQATASAYDTTTTITAVASPSTTSSSQNISIISLPSNYTTSNYIAYSPILQSTQTALDVPVGGGGGGSATTAAVPITYAIVTTYTPVPSPVTGQTQVSLALPAVTPAAAPVMGQTQVSLSLPAETLTVTMPTQRTTEAFTLVPVLVTGGAQSAQSGGGSAQTTILAQPELLSQAQGGSTASHPGGPSPTIVYLATALGASAAAAGGNANTHVPGVPLTAGGAPVVVGGTTYSLASSGGALYANGVSTTLPGGAQTPTTSGHAGVAAAVMSAFSTATGFSTGAASGRSSSAGAGSAAASGSASGGSGSSGSAASTLTSAVSGPSRTSGASGAAVQTASGGAVLALPGLRLSALGMLFAVAGGLLAV
ncbi:hypothetical protein LTR87_011239 [Friedmanniomyces endolithicus]|nr:hypothetical protein LTR87_011239 [Friedmanniomyces endolithicus]